VETKPRSGRRVELTVAPVHHNGLPAVALVRHQVHVTVAVYMSKTATALK